MRKIDHSEKALRAVRDARKLRDLPEWREGRYCLVCRFWKWPCRNCGEPAKPGVSAGAAAFESLFNPTSRR